MSFVIKIYFDATSNLFLALKKETKRLIFEQSSNGLTTDFFVRSCSNSIFVIQEQIPYNRYITYIYCFKYEFQFLCF